MSEEIIETKRIDMKTGPESEAIEYLWDRLREKRGMRGMPERFQYIVCFFSHKCRNMDPVHKFEKYYPKCIAEYDLDNVGEDHDSYCICSHYIHELYFIVNRINGNILRTGNVCIKKLGDKRLKRSVTIQKRKRDYKKNGSGKFKMCVECLKFRIPRQQHRTVCGKCSHDLKPKPKPKPVYLPQTSLSFSSSTPTDSSSSDSFSEEIIKPKLKHKHPVMIVHDIRPPPKFGTIVHDIRPPPSPKVRICEIPGCEAILPWRDPAWITVCKDCFRQMTN